jgi:hypothetical protein
MAITDQDLRSEQSRHINLRTRISIWVIVIGLANFLAYAVAYDVIGGEAVHGYVGKKTVDGKIVERHYFLVESGDAKETSRAVWIYSAVHSTSIWVTVGAILLAMLTLAKDRIISSMRSTIIRGRTFITIVATIVTLVCVLMTLRFTLVLIRSVNNPVEIPGP